LYLFVHAVVQEKGADFKYKKAEAVDSNTPKELELKIQKIEVFSEIKDKLINTLTLTLPMQQLSEDFADELTELVLKNKGNVNLYLQVVDENSPNKVMLFARQHRIQINKKVYHTLKHAQSKGLLDFQVL
jgi:DNA polymerase-3 subunit alpha